ncbi:MAG: hypothetical protein HY865_23420 [Chloroflexi bacterium]|nr:hypothetical protein [Chloroflexota bacterium]
MHISVRILGTKSRQRYAVRRLVAAAETVLRSEYPDLEVEVFEVKTESEISKYTPVLIAPGLVVNEKLVYDIWIPTKEQVIGWMREALLVTAAIQDACPSDEK